MEEYNIPLPQSMLAIGIVGFATSMFFTIYQSISLSWGFTFMLFFFILIVASYINMAPKYE